jgi:hypothetical protein
VVTRMPRFSITYSFERYPRNLQPYWGNGSLGYGQGQGWAGMRVGYGQG